MTFHATFCYSTLFCNMGIHSGTMKGRREFFCCSVLFFSIPTLNGPRLMTQKERQNNFPQHFLGYQQVICYCCYCFLLPGSASQMPHLGKGQRDTHLGVCSAWALWNFSAPQIFFPFPNGSHNSSGCSRALQVFPSGNCYRINKIARGKGTQFKEPLSHTGNACLNTINHVDYP